jgi:hypothetical protein
MPGDTFFVIKKKRLILGDLKVLNASQPFTVCMILTSWGIAKSDLAYCSGFPPKTPYRPYAPENHRYASLDFWNREFSSGGLVSMLTPICG